ncbi:MAG: AAA family ATPase [Chromatiaceae bacterium]|nr:AAA family ATPase [Chromatiaceae bacterium]MCF7993405.1 AAA family ATPase [Chromatiaceae bacterium]MCF8015498.1 AAA family ATPase [Chromatiaceae bacterium]
MPTQPSLWLQDFSQVAPSQRRLARYLLQLLRSVPLLKGRLGRSRRRHPLAHQLDMVEHLLALIAPLLDQQALASRFPELSRAIALSADAAEGWQQDLDDELDLERIGKAFDRVLREATTTLLKRLRREDGEATASASVAVLSQGLGLGASETTLLDYIEQYSGSESLRQVLRRTQSVNPRANQRRLAGLLALPEAEIQALLARNARLRQLGLIEVCDREGDLEDAVRPTTLLQEVLNQAPRTTEALLELLIEPAPQAVWPLTDFPHLAKPAQRLASLLAAAAQGAECGINALFYGAPGTGKTELARAVIAAQGLRAYQVRSSDNEGDGLSRSGRLSAYLLAQQLLARRRDAVLIFDEVEDVFETSDSLMALWRGRTTGREKGWMNRILEQNRVPAIWITNSTGGMDPAFLRRFLVPIAFTIPPRSVRRRMVAAHLGDQALPETLLDDLAADIALAPAQFGAARRLLDLHTEPNAPQAGEATVRDGVAALRTLLHGAPSAPRRAPATRFDSAYLNLGGEITPAAILRALERHGRGTLCFYGPPGTGKTAFAEVLSEALDRELVARQASDLVSKYVGETEQNLARLFREIDAEHSVLLLDEVDSFLADRRAAEHSWERTEVNELLQQMERYPGIFIAATNLISRIDAAALRRFDFKLNFRALTPAQRLRLFAREALGDEDAEVPEMIARHLRSLEALTPGDVANVCRQRALLDEQLSPEQFLRRLIAECRLKQREERQAA